MTIQTHIVKGRGLLSNPKKDIGRGGRASERPEKKKERDWPIVPLRRDPQSEIKAASAALDETMKRAIRAAGCKDAAEFAKLPRTEQNDFMAQARGEQNVPNRDGVKLLDPETCEPSPFNRDVTLDDIKDDLLPDVRKNGVRQNGIVRPHPKPHGKVVWQVVAGERRWLAAKTAKKLYPAAVHDLDDTEALEVQASENLLRKDLSAIEEATKYGQLVAAYEGQGSSRTEAVQRIEEKTGKGRSTIYSRLALLNLPASTQKAVQSGKLAPSIASILTELVDHDTIEELVKLILKPKPDEVESGAMSFRRAKELVDAAVQREENLAQWKRMAEEFRDKGWVVLSPAECLAATPHDTRDWRRYLSVSSNSNYVAANTTCNLHGAGFRDYGKLWRKAPPGVLSRTPDCTPVVIYERAAADLAVQNGGKLSKGGSSSGSSKTSDEERERNRAHRRRVGSFNEAISKVLVGICSPKVDAFELQRQMTLTMVSQWRCEPLRRLIARRGWPKEGTFQKTIEKAMSGMSTEQLRGVMLEILLNHEAPSAYGKDWGSSLEVVCELCEVPLAPWEEKKVQTSGR